MIRSPLFYVGDKYKLIPQLLELFPKDIDLYVEPFLGGGSSFLAVNSKDYYANDIDTNVVKLHQFLLKYCDKKEEFFSEIYKLIEKYGFSCSFKRDIIPSMLKKRYPKTYYAKFNKESYARLKEDYNHDKNDFFRLYLLLVYGFNHMLRFNTSGNFNLPVGNVDFNKNVVNSLNCYFDINKNRPIKIKNNDFVSFINSLSLNKQSFIYLDPPYYISMSEYNKYWNLDDERRLYDFLDTLNEKGIRFGLTNLLFHKGRKNELLENFARKYKSKTLKSNYISFNDNTIKTQSIELYVYNY